MRNYESNGEKLVTVRQEMTGVLEALSHLNNKTLSPLRLREWSAQKMVIVSKIVYYFVIIFLFFFYLYESYLYYIAPDIPANKLPSFITFQLLLLVNAGPLL